MTCRTVDSRCKSQWQASFGSNLTLVIPNLLQVGAWGGCAGDAPSGYSLRQARCTDASGATLNASACSSGSGSSGNTTSALLMTTTTLRPLASAACYAPPQGTALCKYPGMVGIPSCSGRGTCTYTGGGGQ